MKRNNANKSNDLSQYRVTTEKKTARVGIFCDGRLEAYICANDEEQVPHIHISGLSDDGDWAFATAVKLCECHYYLHCRGEILFSTKKKRLFAQFMRARPQDSPFRTNYELAVSLWNSLNPNAKADLERHANGRLKIPDYENILPLDPHEDDTFDMARLGSFDDRKLEVYVGTDDTFSHPHIHVRDRHTLGREFLTAVYLLNPQYVDSHSNCQFTEREKQLFISFLQSEKVFGSIKMTYYEFAVDMWNSQNNFDNIKKDFGDGQVKIPDYEQLPTRPDGHKAYREASIGRFYHGRYQAFIRIDDEEQTPHLHVRDYNTMGQYQEYAIDLRTNQYLKPHTPCIMEHTVRREFARFMLAKPDRGQFITNRERYVSFDKYSGLLPMDGSFANNYELAYSLWNEVNPSAKMLAVYDASRNVIVPDYDDLWPLPDGDSEFDWWIHEYATVRWFNNERLRLLVTEMPEKTAEKPYFKLMNYAEPNTRWARIRFDSPHYADGSADKYQWRLNPDEQRRLVTALRQPDGDRMYSPDGDPITLWQQLITSFNRENGADLLPPDLPMPDYEALK